MYASAILWKLICSDFLMALALSFYSVAILNVFRTGSYYQQEEYPEQNIEHTVTLAVMFACPHPFRFTAVSPD